MAIRDKFADNCGADEAGGSRDEDAHAMFSRLIGSQLQRKIILLK
jgi:hypothetical protein